MKINCPNQKCNTERFATAKIGLIVRNGTFFRRSDSRNVRRYFCKGCGTYFSSSTNRTCSYQKKRRITEPLKTLLCSGVSQRRAAHILGVNPKTVVRRFRFLAEQARKEHDRWMSRYVADPIEEIQFDDLETSEHTKCKPLSVCLAVEPKRRKILSFKVSEMPARGLLADKARKKYGLRKDRRYEGWGQMMNELKPYVAKRAKWTSDENPHYQKVLFQHHCLARHVQVKGGRGCIAGQGELKKLKFDPLFSLNHTCAMLRANMNRLFRRTWCSTKTIQGLRDHLAIYIVFHNKFLTVDQ